MTEAAAGVHQLINDRLDAEALARRSGSSSPALATAYGGADGDRHGRVEPPERGVCHLEFSHPAPNPALLH